VMPQKHLIDTLVHLRGCQFFPIVAFLVSFIFV
jgi:hypothetical protein